MGEFSVNHISRHMLLVNSVLASDNFDHFIKVTFVRRLHFKVLPIIINQYLIRSIETMSISYCFSKFYPLFLSFSDDSCLNQLLE